ncbi:hypothetical protein Tco_0331861 [Tanacetum coccineum]
MVVEGEVLNDFPRFIGILIAEFTVGDAVNLALKMKGDMIIKKLDLKPTIDAMRRQLTCKAYDVYIFKTPKMVTEDIPMEETSLDESTTKDESTTEDESGDEEECPTCHFGILDHAYQVYKEYATKGGFEIKRGGQQNDVRLHGLKKAKSKYFYYVKEGLKAWKPIVKETNPDNEKKQRQIRSVFKLMKEMYGGFENIGATTTDCKNEIRDMNVFVSEDDAQMAIDKLLSKQEFLHDFFVRYKTDKNDALTGLF